MGVKLKEETRAKLVEALAARLPNLSIEKNIFLTFASKQVLSGLDDLLADSRSRTDKAARSALSEMIDDRPVEDFVVDYIGEMLRKHHDYDGSANPVALRELVSVTDFSALAQEIVAALEGLPQSYRFTVLINPKLHELLAEDVSEFVIAPTCRLVRVTEAFRDRYEGFPRSAPSGILGAMGSDLGSLFSADFRTRSFADGAVALQLDVPGFVDRYGESHTAAAAISLLKSFFGLGFAFSLFQRDVVFLSEEAREKVYFHRHEGSGHTYVGDRGLDRDSAALLWKITLDDAYRATASGLNQRTRINGVLSAIGAYLSDGTGWAKLRLASRWFFDSMANNDELSAFVQAVIVLETLLGEADAENKNLSLGALLRNRCAYLIAKSQSERKEIMATFPRIYQVRSDIVHSGKSRLTSSERELLFTLRWYCRRVILEEAILLRANG
jgi:hypothetical protein